MDTTIRIDTTTRDRFNKHGTKGQSSNDLLNDILDKVEVKTK